MVAKKDGLFRYIPQGHKLAQVQDRDLRDELSRAAWNQEFIKEAPAVFVITAFYSRTTGRYDERGIRYVHIEVGHAAQNLHLMAVALGLGSVPVGAFNDELIKKLLKLSKDEEPLYLVPVGYAR
jgi:SagB-type dehydrogenase family enzyme